MTINQEMNQIIILDDDFQLGEMLKDFLNRSSKSHVVYCPTVEDFWEELKHQEFDILFLDYRLTEKNGIDILKELSQKGIMLPTVMMTGEGNEHIAASAIQNGAMDYLIKGQFLFNELPLLIQKAVQIQQLQKTARKHLNQVKYQALLLNNMRDAVVVWDMSGKIDYWSKTAESIFNIPASEMRGKNIKEVYANRFIPSVSLPDQGFNSQYDVERLFPLANGQNIWISSQVSTLFSTDFPHQPIGYMDVVRDITPRKIEHEKLIQSQNFINHMVETSPNIIIIVDYQTMKVNFINPEIEAILGYSPEEYMQDSPDLFIQSIYQDDIEGFHQHFQRLMGIPDGQIVEISYRIFTRSQKLRWLNSRETIFSRDDNGKPKEIICAVQDITEIKINQEQIEKRLHREELLSGIMSQFLNISPDATNAGVRNVLAHMSSFMDAEVGVVYEVFGNKLVKIHEFAQKRDATRICSGAIDLDEIIHIHKQLHQLEPIIIKAYDNSISLPILDELPKILIPSHTNAILAPLLFNNRLLGLMVIASSESTLEFGTEDVSMLTTIAGIFSNALIHQKADRELRMSEARYRAIVEDHQTEMICRFSPEFILTFVNEAYCRFYNKTREDLLGNSFLKVVHNDDNQRVEQVLTSMTVHENIKTFEQRVIINQTKIRWQEWVCRAITDNDSQVLEYQAVGRDITERKYMEVQLAMAQTRLTQAARLASIGELASGVAHQISNPLTTIIAEAQLLMHAMNPKNPDRESAEAILHAGWQAQKVINELMKFSQPSEDYDCLVDVNETIEKALLLASAHLQAAGIVIDVSLGKNLPTIRGNIRQLTDVWVNLLLLSRSAIINGQQNKIRISTRLGINGIIEVEFTDNGKLIPLDLQDTIFEPKLIPSESMRGTGIELSLCREIIRKHAGDILFISENRHTKFNIRLPKGLE